MVQNMLEKLNFRNYILKLLECFSIKVRHSINNEFLVVTCEGGWKE